MKKPKPENKKRKTTAKKGKKGKRRKRSERRRERMRGKTAAKERGARHRAN